MALLLNWRLWVLCTVLALYPIAYMKGRHDSSKKVRSEWTASIATSNAEARALENARQRRADESAQLAAARTTRLVADSAHARNELGGLRNAIESRERASQESLAAANNATRLLGDLLQSCTARYTSVGEAADRATSEALELRQAWPR